MEVWEEGALRSYADTFRDAELAFSARLNRSISWASHFCSVHFATRDYNYKKTHSLLRAMDVRLNVILRFPFGAKKRYKITSIPLRNKGGLRLLVALQTSTNSHNDFCG